MSKSRNILKTFIDGFSGIGGFHLALALFRLRCVFAFELSIKCRSTYQLNFDLLPAGNVYHVEAKAVPRHDVACFGLPCQAFSKSGARLGEEDPRGVLHREALRIVLHHLPTVVLAENVPQFKTQDGGPAYHEFVDRLTSAGYRVYDQEINAGDHGLPQRRHRLYIVAIKESALVQDFVFPAPAGIKVELQSVLEPPALVAHQVVDIADWTRNPKARIPWDRIGTGLIRIGHIKDGTQGDIIYSPRGHAATITARSGGRGAGMGLYKVGRVIRRLSVTEAAKCFGFPESYRFLCSEPAAASQLGNAVAVNPVVAIMTEVYRAVGQEVPEAIQHEAAGKPPENKLAVATHRHVVRRSPSDHEERPVNKDLDHGTP